MTTAQEKHELFIKKTAMACGYDVDVVGMPTERDILNQVFDNWINACANTEAQAEIIRLKEQVKELIKQRDTAYDHLGWARVLREDEKEHARSLREKV